MGVPKTWFTKADDVSIAYQVLGDEPVDLVYAWGAFSNIEMFWEEPALASFLRRLSDFSRLILYDRRGCGVSDRGGNTTTPTLEERVQDVIAVLDAVDSERASIFGMSEGGQLAALLAATHPERIASIIAYGTPARFLRDAEHPWGLLADDDTGARFIDALTQGWGFRSDFAVQLWAPSMAGDERFKDWMAKFARQSLSRAEVRPVLLSAFDYDLVDVFAAVRTPALVLHRRDDRLVPVSHGRWIAQHLSDARFIELSGGDHFPFLGDTEEVLVAVEEFVRGSRAAIGRSRKLLTVMFTDITNSAELLTSLGDDAWRELLASHDQMIRDYLTRFEGDEIKHLGDGFLMVFEGPARAVRCALGILDASQRLGLAVRVGVHSGECDITDEDLSGIAVHVAARIVDRAAAGEILVSNSVRDLVAGSGIRFGEGRQVELSGIPGPRIVFPVLRHGATPDVVRRLAIDQTNMLRLDGDYWTVAYGGRVVSLRDSKGLRDIARLLATPNQEFHVLDLIAEADGDGRSMSRPEIDEAGLNPVSSGDEPIIDQTAKAQYVRRLHELQRQLDEAEAEGDDVGLSAARDEYEVLLDQLGSAYGLGGRTRRAPDHIERARKTVSRRIRDAVRRTSRAHPSLARHLDASLRTGVFCSYEPEQNVNWTVIVS